VEVVMERHGGLDSLGVLGLDRTAAEWTLLAHAGTRTTRVTGVGLSG
jgi:hypothetical protein